jgi:mono/diheme cytochrome c family protein
MNDVVNTTQAGGPVRSRRLGRIIGAALLFALAAVGALSLIAAMALLGPGISARPEPTATEARIARVLRSMGIPGEAKRLANAASPSADVLDSGRAHFADHCAICHANDGSGKTEMGRALYPRAPDLRLRATQDLSDGELFYIIENGVRFTGMPAWGDGGEESRRANWQLVTFIRHLPQLSAEEKVEMEDLNPKGPAEWRELQEDEQFLEGKESTRPADRRDGAHRHGELP